MKLIIEIKDDDYRFITKTSSIPFGIDLVENIMNGTPLPKGHWVTEDDNKKLKSLNKAKRCSNCDFRHLALRHYNYCPNCGAEMRGEHNADSN